MPDKLVELRTETGQPVVLNGVSITPQSQALIIHPPHLPSRQDHPRTGASGMVWGLVWNRPLAVRVETPGAAAQTIPVWDVTRLGQLVLLGLGILGSIIIRRVIHD